MKNKLYILMINQTANAHLEYVCTQICIYLYTTVSLIDSGASQPVEPPDPPGHPRTVNKSSNVYTHCAIQIQLVSKVLSSKRMVK